MSAQTSLGDEDIDCVKAYAKEVSDTFGCIFDGEKNRFKSGHRLIVRFMAAIDGVLKNGRGKFSAVDETHNELCIAASILRNPNPKFSRVEYEPSLAGCAKTIDFRALTADGVTFFIDVKTIKPKPKDRWDQFEKASKECWFPENARLVLSKQWLGGELWHESFAARGRMLEYTIELEQKIVECRLQAEKTFFVLVLCGEGICWHEDELEDFVSFYFAGIHRPDDPFSKAETKYIVENKFTLARTISRFACLRRHQGDLHYKRLNWNVQPPHNPSFE